MACDARDQRAVGILSCHSKISMSLVVQATKADYSAPTESDPDAEVSALFVTPAQGVFRATRGRSPFVHEACGIYCPALLAANRYASLILRKAWRTPLWRLRGHRRFLIGVRSACDVAERCIDAPRCFA